VLRRRKTVDSPVIKVADLILDPKKHEVTRSGKSLDLTPKEYCLLDTLIRREGQAVTREELIAAAWGHDFKESGNELSVHMRYIRRKVDASPWKPLIHTVHGVGYSLRA
jgi:DNA-binding response OmpR family regulator